jgi:hypothetical protein
VFPAQSQKLFFAGNRNSPQLALTQAISDGARRRTLPRGPHRRKYIQKSLPDACCRIPTLCRRGWSARGATIHPRFNRRSAWQPFDAGHWIACSARDPGGRLIAGRNAAADAQSRGTAEAHGLPDAFRTREIGAAGIVSITTTSRTALSAARATGDGRPVHSPRRSFCNDRG